MKSSEGCNHPIYYKIQHKVENISFWNLLIYAKFLKNCKKQLL